MTNDQLFTVWFVVASLLCMAVAYRDGVNSVTRKYYDTPDLFSYRNLAIMWYAASLLWPVMILFLPTIAFCILTRYTGKMAATPVDQRGSIPNMPDIPPPPCKKPKGDTVEVEPGVPYEFPADPHNRNKITDLEIKQTGEGKSVIQSAREAIDLDISDAPGVVTGTGVKPPRQGVFSPGELVFEECEVCDAKPGSPRLCEPCLHNRTVISKLTSLLEEARGIQ